MHVLSVVLCQPVYPSVCVCVVVLYRPIHDAIELGCLELVKLLIDYNADVMMEFGERTAVEFAMEHNQREIAEYIKGVMPGLSRLVSILGHHKWVGKHLYNQNIL